ncbi:MAG: methylmalonyl-CoA mutase family protein, partial [Polyangia bacterium]
TNAFDEALALPTEASARLALRTQQVLAHESGIGDIVDPLGGSYAVESLTSEIEKRAEEHIKRIDEMGGMVAAIEQSWPQREIEQRAYEYQRKIETKQKIIVGVNEFQTEEPPYSDLQRIDPSLEREQAARVGEVRSGRDAQKAAEATRALTAAANGTENLLPRIVDCVKSAVTVGEISDALRSVFGEHRESRH